MKKHGYEVNIYVKDKLEPIDREFCESEKEAKRVREKAYEENDDIEYVIIDEVIFDDVTGESYPA